MSGELTDVDKVYDALQAHAWEATYCRLENPMECYCGATMKDHEQHLAEEIVKALNRTGQTFVYVVD